MNNKIIHFIFFSPTGTTRTTLEAIAKGTGCTTGSTVNLTLEAPSDSPEFSEADLVLVGMPVYGGRLPALAAKRFKSIAGNGAAVVPVVVYGNRHYDDCLVELYDLCKEQGFHPVAAGAFLGEHSFSTAALPLSVGRPDAADLEKAEAFGRNITEEELRVERVPGNRPYKERMQPAGSATSVDAATCIQCGKCIEVCPTQGMHMTETAAESHPDNCIWCMACERICPVHARTLTHEKVMVSARKLSEFFSERREPETFLA
ncbi:4Fe-4S dicluster domain-containing protein [Pontiellaceae bacterium B1224]|nr:4Fe-4S dicluster domain-containing protein [Pontiellaceae bacterium B1224]